MHGEIRSKIDCLCEFLRSAGFSCQISLQACFHFDLNLPKSINDLHSRREYCGTEAKYSHTWEIDAVMLDNP
jgi:hypothetical protein